MWWRQSGRSHCGWWQLSLETGLGYRNAHIVRGSSCSERERGLSYLDVWNDVLKTRGFILKGQPDRWRGGKFHLIELVTQASLVRTTRPRSIEDVCNTITTLAS
ncbi:unnamed protein product [Cuscuta europaea]|uniref:Uncharacterized protein n=1 Tax=Cuscuta europaea TaxID=41803 RepID=A0A9P0ZM59_CUSEU|nr:unnamed protein product [Cuscuta europaea]